MDNAIARQRELMDKYYATIERFEQLKEAKRQDLRHRMFEKEEQAKERRNQLQLLEKRRIILMHRKFALENGLVRQRLRLMRLKKRRQYADQIKCLWDDHANFRLQCKVRDETLLALDQELHSYNVMKRSKEAQQSYENDLQKIQLTRARLVMDRYPGRSREDLVCVMISEVRRLLKLQLEEELALARSSMVDVSAPSSTATVNHGMGTRTMNRAPKTSATSLKSKTGSAMSMRLKTIPYEPQHLTSVGLIDNVRGYGKLTDADIRKAVESSYDTALNLNKKISAQQVLEDANVIMLRICKGYANDIPRDVAVMECIQRRVQQMLKRIQAKFLDRVRSTHAARVAQASKDNAPDTQRLTKPPREMAVQFGETCAINTSAYEPTISPLKSVQTRRPTKTIPVKIIARNILTADEERPVDDQRIQADDMRQRSIAHLYDFQKVMILDNLDRFESTLVEKLEADLMKTFNFNTCAFSDPVPTGQKLTNQERLVDEIADTVLTLPEKDNLFGRRILATAAALKTPILSQIQTELAKIHEIEPEQQPLRRDEDSSQELGLCCCFGGKSKRRSSTD